MGEGNKKIKNFQFARHDGTRASEGSAVDSRNFAYVAGAMICRQYHAVY
jgi:hypothetical protein